MSQTTDVISITDLEKMAAAVAKSGLFGIKTPDQAMALMLIAQAEGVHPGTVAQEYDIIQGRPARKTNSVLARYQKAGGTVKWVELTETCAHGIFTHPSSGPVEMKWTLEQAKTVKSYNNDKKAWEALPDKLVWQNYPRAMLRARCIAEAIRASYPAAIGGMLVVEEAQDLDPITIEGTATVVKDTVPGPVKKAETGSTGATPAASATPPAEKAATTPPAEGKPVPVADAKPKEDETGETLPEQRAKIFKAKLDVAGITEETFVKKFGKKIEACLKSQSAEIQAFIDAGGK